MSEVPTEMDDATHERLSELCAKGDALAAQKRYDDALTCYGQAWELIPESKVDWNASTWVLAAIADACFLKGDFGETRKALEFAMLCPEAIGNPFLHLRLGQALFEQSEEDRAADELIRAYMGAGADIFSSEDPKYLAFLSTRAKLD